MTKEFQQLETIQANALLLLTLAHILKGTRPQTCRANEDKKSSILVYNSLKCMHL